MSEPHPQAPYPEAPHSEEEMILESVRRLVAEEIKPRAPQLDRDGVFPLETARLLAREGFLSPLLPEQYGGSGLSWLTFVRIIEEIATACASSALLLIAQADGMMPLLQFGSTELCQRTLPRLAESEPTLTAFAATEPGAGSDILAMKTRAVRHGDRYTINGQKCFITNGAVADFFTLYAYTDPTQGPRGISAFVVEKGTPGLSYGKNEDKMGMRGSVNSVLYFDDMEIDANQRIGPEGQGFTNLMTCLDGSRLFAAAQAVGLARGALQEAIDYAKTRVQFGKPIARQPVIQDMIAEMATQTEAARQLTWHAASSFDQKAPSSSLRQLAAMAKIQASDNAMRLTTNAVQIMGGYGYSREFPVERMMRDAKLIQIYTGTNQILRYVVGRELLKE